MLSKRKPRAGLVAVLSQCIHHQMRNCTTNQALGQCTPVTTWQWRIPYVTIIIIITTIMIIMITVQHVKITTESTLAIFQNIKHSWNILENRSSAKLFWGHHLWILNKRCLSFIGVLHLKYVYFNHWIFIYLLFEINEINQHQIYINIFDKCILKYCLTKEGTKPQN